MQISELKKDIESLKKQVAVLYRAKHYPNKNCFTTQELADMVGCSLDTIREYEKTGKLVARYPNAKKRFHPDDVEYYLRGRTPRKKAQKNSK